MIKRINDEANILPFKKVASETFAIGDVVTTNSSGYITKATSTTAPAKLLGQIQRDVLATDADYALNSDVDVDVFCDADDVYTADVSTGTLVQSMVGSSFDLDDHNSINVNQNSIKAVKIVRVLSTTKARVLFNVVPAGVAGIRSIQQTVSVSSFTDGGSTAGTLAMNATIPKGAVVVQTFLTDIVGFAGDTSAVITVGDGTDVDRYNTATPDVFTTATDISAGAVSGTAFHSASKTPTLTITSATDFTAVKTNALGQVTVTILYYVAR